MLKISNGQIAYGTNIILNEIDLEILPSNLSIIIGPNGVGKTSLLNVIAGNKKLTSGELRNDFKKRILIPQLPFYPDGVTLFEYASSIHYEKTWNWNLDRKAKEATKLILEKLNLFDKKDQYMNQLSGGELQLANIALCLISGADLILLDEPAANLDLLNQVMVLEMFKKLTQKETSIVAIMHDINFAHKFGDRFILLFKNDQLLYGDKSDIFTKENLNKAYNVDFKVVAIEEDTFIQPHI